MQCKSLWIKASAKCMNVKLFTLFSTQTCIHADEPVKLHFVSQASLSQIPSADKI